MKLRLCTAVALLLAAAIPHPAAAQGWQSAHAQLLANCLDQLRDRNLQECLNQWAECDRSHLTATERQEIAEINGQRTP